MHHHRVDAQVLQQGDIPGEGGLELRLQLGGAAVFDHHGLALEALHVRQGLQQDFGFFDVFVGHSFSLL